MKTEYQVAQEVEDHELEQSNNRWKQKQEAEAKKPVPPEPAALNQADVELLSQMQSVSLEQALKSSTVSNQSSIPKTESQNALMLSNVEYSADNQPPPYSQAQPFVQQPYTLQQQQSAPQLSSPGMKPFPLQQQLSAQTMAQPYQTLTQPYSYASGQPYQMPLPLGQQPAFQSRPPATPPKPNKAPPLPPSPAGMKQSPQGVKPGAKPSNQNDPLQKYYEMGFSQDGVRRASALYADEKDMIEFLIPFEELRQKGLRPDYVQLSLSAYPGDVQKCEQFCISMTSLAEFGFNLVDIKNALTKHKNNRDQALEELLKK
ncbi:hypothetical protein EDD86DRAFT_51727 [Gorgonomyces haynaldii]|nr:hypothetical protein EDD86DRAFT_51727 [Gorgonomyces haynaldii]